MSVTPAAIAWPPPFIRIPSCTACRTAFPQSDFLSSSGSNTITSWATFDALCLFEAYTGQEDTGLPADLRAVGNRDVAEDVWAGYVMASYESELGGLPVSGNVGLRVVDTAVTSTGLRADLEVVNNPDGTISLVETGDFDTVVIEQFGRNETLSARRVQGELA